jgi:hypothetical protein
MLQTAFNRPLLCLSRRCYGAVFRRHSSKAIAADNRYFKVSEEVREAIHTGKPVVALETTIYTHGTRFWVVVGMSETD